MNNKVIVKLSVPELDKSFDIFLPVNKKIGNILVLINKTLNDLSGGSYPITNECILMNLDTKEIYPPDVILINTSIRNGSRVMILTTKKESSL